MGPHAWTTLQLPAPMLNSGATYTPCPKQLNALRWPHSGVKFMCFAAF